MKRHKFLSTNRIKSTVVSLLVILTMIASSWITVYADNDPQSGNGGAAQNIDKNIQAMEDELERIRAFINQAPDSELDRVLALHEYICGNYCYDYDYANDSFGYADQIMINYTGVCQAYAYALLYIGRKLGIPVTYEHGGATDSAGHAWNSIKVDGKWYRVDMTWDGGGSRFYGDISRKNLLLSDEAFKETGHRKYYEGTYSPKFNADDTTFDNYWWNSFTDDYGTYGTNNGPIRPYNGKWYYFSNKMGIVKRDSAYADANVEVIIPENKIFLSSQIIKYHYMTIHNDKLYFTGSKNGTMVIFQSEMDGSNISVVAEGLNDAQVCGLDVKDDKLYLANYRGGVRNERILLPGEEAEEEASDISGISIIIDSPDDLRTPQKIKAIDTGTGKEIKRPIWRVNQNQVAQVIDDELVPLSPGEVTLRVHDWEMYKEDSVKITVPASKTGSRINDLIAVKSGDTTSFLKWTARPGATLYRVYLGHYSFDEPVLKPHTYNYIGSTTDTEFEIAGYDPNEKYEVCVVPEFPDGLVERSATVLAHDAEDLPQNIDVTQVGDSYIKVDWVKSDTNNTMIEVLDLESRNSYYAHNADEQMVVYGLTPNTEYRLLLRYRDYNTHKYVVVKTTNTQSELEQYKAAAAEDLDNYLDLSLYREAEKGAIAEIIDAAKTEIYLAKTKAQVDIALARAKSALDKIKTDQILTEEDAAGDAERQEALATLADTISDAESLAQNDYLDEGYQELQQAIEEARSVIGNPDANTDRLNEAAADITAKKNALVRAVVVMFYNGENAVEIVKIKRGESIDKPNDPSKTGHDFGGWYTDSSFNYKYDFTRKIYDHLKLHARWVMNKEYAETLAEAQAKAESEAKAKAEAEAKAKEEALEWKGTLDNKLPAVKSAKVKAAKRSIKVTWRKLSKKNLKKFDKVEIQLCTNKKFAKKDTKRYIVSKSKTVYTIKKLRKGKTYYVRVRYVKGSGSAKKVSKWSVVKKVRL